MGPAAHRPGGPRAGCGTRRRRAATLSRADTGGRGLGRLGLLGGRAQRRTSRSRTSAAALHDPLGLRPAKAGGTVGVFHRRVRAPGPRIGPLARMATALSHQRMDARLRPSGPGPGAGWCGSWSRAARFDNECAREPAYPGNCPGAVHAHGCRRLPRHSGSRPRAGGSSGATAARPLASVRAQHGHQLLHVPQRKPVGRRIAEHEAPTRGVSHTRGPYDPQVRR